MNDADTILYVVGIPSATLVGYGASIEVVIAVVAASIGLGVGIFLS